MKAAKLAVGLLACAGLASCNWYDVTAGQRCCSGGVVTVPTTIRPGTETQRSNNTDNGPCNEDQPCWNCLTMGNHICGPGATLPNGTVVNPASDPRTYDGYGFICQVERSQVPGGFEVIAYPPGMTPTVEGIQVPC